MRVTGLIISSLGLPVSWRHTHTVAAGGTADTAVAHTEFDPAELFHDFRPGRRRGYIRGRTLPKSIPIRLPHMLDQSLHRLRLRQRNNASAKTSSSHPRSIHSF